MKTSPSRTVGFRTTERVALYPEGAHTIGWAVWVGPFMVWHRGEMAPEWGIDHYRGDERYGHRTLQLGHIGISVDWKRR